MTTSGHVCDIPTLFFPYLFFFFSATSRAIINPSSHLIFLKNVFFIVTLEYSDLHSFKICNTVTGDNNINFNI